MKGNLCGIIGNDTARVDDHTLRIGLFPVFAPPVDVVLRRVFLCDVYLPPARDPLIPGIGADSGQFVKHFLSWIKRGDGSAHDGRLLEEVAAAPIVIVHEPNVK